MKRLCLSGMLIGLEKEELSEVQNDIKEFIPKIDNWAVCDVFCGGLKITKKYKKEMWDFLQKYLKSEKEFEIRFGVVMILSYYIEDEYLKKDLEILDKINTKEYYAKMAIAWAISVALVRFYEITLKYLEDSHLDIFTYNKSIQKAIESYRLTDIQKERLRAMKKKL